MLHIESGSGFFRTNCTILSRKMFNLKFNSSLVVLPMQMIAQGFEGQLCYQYKEYKSLKDAQVAKARYPIFLQYWIEHIHSHTQSEGNEKKIYYFVATWTDGYRTNIPYSGSGLKLCQFPEYKFKDNSRLFQKAEQSIDAITCYPILHRNHLVFAMSAHITDNYSILIPDTMYIQSEGYKTKRALLNENQIPFKSKINKLLYRGSVDLGQLSNIKIKHSTLGKIQRKYLFHLFNENVFDKSLVNFHEKDYMSIEEQIKYKYILDIEGTANSWAGTFWKLYSGSLVLKADGIWKQWYYDKLFPWVHYVPVNQNFSDLMDKIKWCLQNEDRVIQIVNNSRRFIEEELNWESVKNFTIQTFNNRYYKSFYVNI